MYNQTELQAAMTEGLNARGTLIADGGTKIAALLAESLAAVKTARASQEWRAYTDFVAGIVIDGLCSAAVAGMKFLTTHVSPCSCSLALKPPCNPVMRSSRHPHNASVSMPCRSARSCNMPA